MRFHAKALILIAAGAAGGGCRPAEPAPWAGEPLVVPVGAHPVDVAAGDLDGDGRLDLMSLDAGDRTLSVRLRREDAWVAPPGEPIAAGVGLHLLALADLDRDRDLDVVATGHDSGGVLVWLGDGAGRFAAAPGSPFVAFIADRPHNHGLAVGDVDGDGDADVVAVDQGARAAAVLLGDGRGALALAPGSPLALGGEPYASAMGDVDRDGRLDLVAPLIVPGAIAVMLGDGAGGFRHAPGSPQPTTLDRPYAIALVDLDRDGVLDVIAPHDDTSKVSVFLGDGHGGLRAGPRSPFSLGVRIFRPAAADLNGDGATDLIGAGSGALITVAGDGRGGFGHPRRERFGGGWTVIAADLDDDGATDLAAPDGDAGAIRIWLGRRR